MIVNALKEFPLGPRPGNFSSQTNLLWGGVQSVSIFFQPVAPSQAGAPPSTPSRVEITFLQPGKAGLDQKRGSKWTEWHLLKFFFMCFHLNAIALTCKPLSVDVVCRLVVSGWLCGAVNLTLSAGGPACGLETGDGWRKGAGGTLTP